MNNVREVCNCWQQSICLHMKMGLKNGRQNPDFSKQDGDRHSKNYILLQKEKIALPFEVKEPLHSKTNP